MRKEFRSASDPSRFTRHETEISHLDDAIDALAIKLSDQEIRQLDEPYKPHVVRDR